ncbi:MAG: lipid droplet-associated protein, partial [Pseudonocardiaceae bacterium]
MPLPVRVAAGLVVTALEQARKFPEQLAEMPVTAASRAVQAGMRVQQRVTQLAIKGDEVFALFRRVEDTPPWARFDEDDEPPPDPGPAAEPAAQRQATVSRISPDPA